MTIFYCIKLTFSFAAIINKEIRIKLKPHEYEINNLFSIKQNTIVKSIIERIIDTTLNKIFYFLDIDLLSFSIGDRKAIIIKDITTEKRKII